MKRLLLSVAPLFAALTLLLSFYNIYAQNLVPNPGFEDYNFPPRPSTYLVYPYTSNTTANHCVLRGDSSLTAERPSDHLGPDTTFVRRWYRGNGATTDYFHRYAVPPPDSLFGNKTYLTDSDGVCIPHSWITNGLETASGDAYAGIFVVRNPKNADGYGDYHEYLATRLTDTLRPGHVYIVRFRYAMAEYADGVKFHRKSDLNPYYIKSLGVAFLDTSLPILNRYRDSTGTEYNWIEGGVTNYMSNTLEFDGANFELIEDHNIAYADSGVWRTFEGTVATYQPGINYMVIGNFSQRIPMSDIELIPGRGGSLADSNRTIYSTYFFIDDVEVKDTTSAITCKCNTTFTCPHTRNDSLQALNPGKCCFTTPVRPSNQSCLFRFLRVKVNGITVSQPSLIDYGGILPAGQTVYASFCTNSRTDDSATVVTYEFIDDDSTTILCVKREGVWCNCPCGLAGRTIANGVATRVLQPILTKIANDTNGNCCWEYSLKNNYSCTFQDTSFVLKTTMDGGATLTAISPWTQTIQGGSLIFSTSDSLKYNSTSKIFKICTSPQPGSSLPPILHVNVYKSAENTGATPCGQFLDMPLECRNDTNCCDQLDIQLRRRSVTAYHECSFELVVRHKNSITPCKVFGIRVKDTNGLVMHTTDTTSTPLNLDRSTVIWVGDLGPCPYPEYQSLSGGYRRTPIFTIEILDSLGNVKCSVRDTFRCCYTSGVVMGKDAIQEEAPPAELPTGGTITNAYIEGKKLHYAINNKSAAARAALRIAGMKGEVIMNLDGELASGMNAGELDISRLASGAYYLTVQTSGWQTSRQFIVIR